MVKIKHLSDRNLDRTSQTAIPLYGLDNLNFIYEDYTYDNKVISFKLLTALEVMYTNKFKVSNLQNFLKNVYSLGVYKYTDSAKQKMVERFKAKSNYTF